VGALGGALLQNQPLDRDAEVGADDRNPSGGHPGPLEVGRDQRFMEGSNSVFSATKRKARGYRSTTHLITMLYFVAGKLRLPQC
jgi:hypothetical protein